MNVDLESLLAQKNKLESCADELQEVKIRLIDHRNSLDQCWNAREMDELSEVIDKLSQNMRRISEDTNEIARSLLAAYQELQTEEEETV